MRNAAHRWICYRLPLGQLAVGAIVGLLLSTCSAEEGVRPAAVVDPELQPYFETFAAEAARRQVDVNAALAQVSASFTVLDGQIGGQCRRSTTAGHAVLIHRDYWQRFSSLQRELLVFHELGHCILQREHLDLADSSGNCVSMMHSGAGHCRVGYTAARREYYLDELFHPEE